MRIRRRSPHRRRPSAPGWSTPHTATPYRVGTYAAGPNGQAVQLFGNGAVQTMTAQIRAIKSDATQGTRGGGQRGCAGLRPSPGLGQRQRAAGCRVDARHPGDRADRPRRDAGLALVAARDGDRAPDRWPGRDGRRDRHRRATATASSPGSRARRAARATDRQGRDAATRSGAPGRHARTCEPMRRSATSPSGIDNAGRPTATWSVNPAGGTALLIGVARGDGTGAFAPAFEEQLGHGGDQHAPDVRDWATAGCSRSGSRARCRAARCT